ncbi:hypothetical protein M885DRAFT_620493 [Pelagophyceae sp. CCMP2097]|nr:hypothetical protein M885DRAFT_620493 [Pelagophyceae sp. CCMP2097]
MTHSAQAKRVSAAAVVRRAFEGVDAYGVARESGKKDRELTFGELDVCDFSGVCSRFTASRPCDQKDSRKIFWDLGSGAGKVVLGLALCDTFSICGGLEIQPALHALAESARGRIEEWRADRAATAALAADAKAPRRYTCHGAAAPAKHSWNKALLKASSKKGAAAQCAAAVVALFGARAYKAALKGAESSSLSKYLQKRNTSARCSLADGRVAFSRPDDCGAAAHEKGAILEEGALLEEESDHHADDAAEPALRGAAETAASEAAAFEAAASETAASGAAPLSAPRETALDAAAVARVSNASLQLPSAAVQFVCGDIFAEDCWHAADVVFCNVLLFGAETLQRLSVAMEKHLKTGAYAWCKASWSGGATLFVYRKQ